VATPGVTLTATLQTITGDAAGSTSNPAKLVIVLCNYGLTLPQIPGTSTIAKKEQTVYFDSAGQVSTLLWGNDVITPTGDTFYAITVIDGEGNVIQAADYQFLGTQTIDLSNATPYNPPPVPVGPTLPLVYGPCTPTPPQAANTIYTAPGLIVAVAYNGTLQRPEIDYEMVGTSGLLFQLFFETYSGDTVYALYFA